MNDTTFSWTKYDGSPHWVHHTQYAGTDQHGHWFHQPAGSLSERPGLKFTTETDCVFLVPTHGNWVAKFFPPHHPGYQLYIDLATNVTYNPEENTVTGVDMDLDVIVNNEGTIWLADEDELIEHTLKYGYPIDLVASTRTHATKLLHSVAHNIAPFNEATIAKWGLSKNH